MTGENDRLFCSAGSAPETSERVETTKMRKHAYLIIAHHQFELLQKTMRILDSETNDFFIHIDAKSKDVPFDEIKGSVSRSKVMFVDRVSLSWGGYNSLICELSLMEAASAGHYGYYHLLSGVDMPLKTKDEIYAFFEKNPGTEYVLFGAGKTPVDIVRRVSHYHPLANSPYFARNRYKLKARIPRVMIDRAQTLLGVNRLRKSGVEVYQGAQWFSITDELVHYLLENRAFIEELYKSTICSDESFVQTMIMRSDFKDRLSQTDMSYTDYHSIMRMIDWVRGNPYVFRSEDYDLLMNSDYLFARKFDQNVDPALIDRIYETIISKQTV